MPDINYPAVVVGAVAAMVTSTIYYVAFSQPMAALNPAAYGTGEQPAKWKLGVELGRNLVLAALVAWLVVSLAVSGLIDGLLLAAALWIGFALVLLTGSVIWERVPAQLAAIHAGDWLLKLVALTIIIVVLS